MRNISFRTDKFILRLFIFIIYELFYQFNYFLHSLLIYTNLLYIFKIFLFLSYQLFQLDFFIPVLWYLIKISVAIFLSFLFSFFLIKCFIYQNIFRYYFGHIEVYTFLILYADHIIFFYLKYNSERPLINWWVWVTIRIQWSHDMG